ncbi:MAG TPA: retropepsin-like aspartic protease [Steroidobacteraceae bacterium]|jgi:predicted aspartyl protease
MKKRLLYSVLLLVCAPLGRIAHGAQPQDCILQRYTSVNLTVDANRRLIVPVTIEGTNGSAILDLGNAFSAIWQNEAAQLKLHQFAFRQGTPDIHWGGAAIRNYATASIALGNARFKQVELMIMPEATRSQFRIGDAVLALLGMDLLSRSDIELDIKHERLALYAPDHCPDRVVYWADDYAAVPVHRGPLGNFYFPIELNGKTVEATLSPGNGSSTLSVDVAKKLYGFEPHSGTHLMQMTAKGLNVTNVAIVLTDYNKPACELSTRDGAAAYAGCYGAYPLEIGLDILSKLHLYLATKEKVLYFTAADTDSVAPNAVSTPSGEQRAEDQGRE